MEIQPAGIDKKRANVEAMFDSIAWRYDFLNHFLSLNFDKLWRKKAIRIIDKNFKHPKILDIATGTGDLAIAAMKLEPEQIAGIDISRKMLEIGREKIRKNGYEGIISLSQGDSEDLPFSDNHFDVAMVAFGVRNFENPLKGLSEMLRVVKDGGMIMVLEFSKPQGFPFRTLYNFYFKNILPVFGRLFSKDKAAYSYLPESVMKFPDNEQFIDLLDEAGWKGNRQIKLTGGIASIYTGFKSNVQ
jgi:demethylmenaquinone methyltransferase / 2-methoxy-6-polyprenyl-1,4-benzoquinol methylase